MADRYWVGGTANWDATAGTKWATTSGGAGGASVPTSTDNVFFDAASGAAVVTISGTVNAADLTFTGFTGTLALTAVATNIVQVFGSLVLGAGMTFTGVSGIIRFMGTVGGTMTSNGKTVTGVVSFGHDAAGNTGTWTLLDALSCGAFRTMSGTFVSGGYSITAGGWQSNSNQSRTVTLGASAITINGGFGSFTSSNGTTTYTANTAVVTMTANADGPGLNNVAGSTTNGMSLVLTGAGACSIFGSAITFANVTRTGTATKTDSLTFSVAVTVTGTLTLTGNSATNRLLVSSGTVGTTRTITAAAVAFTNVDFMDITIAGAAAGAAVGTSVGDAGGNTGISFTAAVTRYGVVAGNWSSTATWSTTSGGAGGASVPLPQDTVILDANSAAGTYTADMPRLGKDLDFTGFTRTFAFSVAQPRVYGSWTLSAGMTLTGGVSPEFHGRGTHTITSAGKTWPADLLFYGTVVGSTYTFTDAVSVRSIYFQGTGGTLTFQGNVTISQLMNMNNGGASRTLNMGSGTWSFTQTSGGVFDVAGGTTPTVNGASAALVIASASASSRSFAGGGKSYGSLTYTVANSPGVLTVTGANSFTTISIGAGRTLTLPSGTVTTATTGVTLAGSDLDYLYMPGVSSANLITPDHASLKLTGDLTIDCEVAMDDWTPAAQQYLVQKLESSTTRGYGLNVQSNGRLGLLWSTDGTDGTLVTRTSTVAVPAADGARIWVRATLDVNNGAGGHDVKFFTSPDGVTWTQLGTTVTTAGVTSVASTTSQLWIGSLTGNAFMLVGKVYRARVYSGYFDGVTQGGSLVANYDATAHDVMSTTYTDSLGRVWTLSGLATWGLGKVTLNASTGGTKATLNTPQATSAVTYTEVVDSTGVPASTLSASTATDSFTAADGTAINGKTTTTGAKTWTASAGTVQSNRASGVGRATFDAGAADVRVTADLINAASSIVDAGLLLRYTDANNYYAAIQLSSGTTQILRRLAGVTTVLASGGGYAGFGGTPTMAFEAIGSSLRLYVNGVLMASAIDTSFLSQTLVGMIRSTQFSDNGTVFDNFDLKPATAPSALLAQAPSTLSNTTGWVTGVLGAMALEVDSILGGALALAAPGAQATETDLAQLGALVLRAAGAQALEADALLAGAVALALFGGQASETDTIAAGALAVAMTGTEATETDTGFAGALRVALAGVQATEADQALVGALAAALVGGQAVDGQLAQLGQVFVHLIANGALSAETDTAPAGGAALVAPGTLASEVDDAFVGVVLISVLGEKALEIDAALGGVASMFVRACMAAAASLVTLMTAEVTDCDGSPMDEWDVGDVARLAVVVTTAATGAAVDPTTITLTVVAPDGTVTTPGVAHDSTGHYHFDLPIDQPGQWRWRWESTGAAAAASEGAFLVQRQMVGA